MAARKRRKTETFKDYREDLKEETKRIKKNFKRGIWWNSHELGTYKMDTKCKNCGCTLGSHSGTSFYSDFYKMDVPKNACPGHEGRMDWDKGRTIFEPLEEDKI